MKTFWKDFPKPILALAPMEGVTDTVFRRVINYCGRPAIYFTEFTNVDGLFSKGKKQVEHRLLFKKEEKPIIAQIWGMKPENYVRAAKQIVEMGFDGIDINMGCPERNVIKRGACAGLIHNKKLATEIIVATKEGAGDLPISTKTRIGIAEIETEDWATFLLEQDLDALIVHCRTAREMSNVPAHWDEMKKVVNARNQINPNTIILGNGDIESLDDAKQKIEQYKIDGIMIGRGIFHDPFLFNPNRKLVDLSFDERMDLLLRHSSLFESEWSKTKHFAILRKFYKIYTHGLPSASTLREKLMNTQNLADVKNVIMEM